MDIQDNVERLTEDELGIVFHSPVCLKIPSGRILDREEVDLFLTAFEGMELDESLVRWVDGLSRTPATPGTDLQIDLHRRTKQWSIGILLLLTFIIEMLGIMVNLIMILGIIVLIPCIVKLHLDLKEMNRRKLS
jgi:hypothetical protein